MPTITDIILQYRELCAYCDSFFVRISQAYPGRMQCAKGCFGCCSLKTVCALEAHIILQHVKRTDTAIRSSDDNALDGEQMCPFLEQYLCALYPARPVICRTHGLAVYIPQESVPDCCPLNFKGVDLQTMNKEDILDLTRITTNLMRLNLAFCIILGDRQLAGKRLQLKDIAHNSIPDSIRKLLDKS